jgi:hypothetical protein
MPQVEDTVDWCEFNRSSPDLHQAGGLLDELVVARCAHWHRRCENLVALLIIEGQRLILHSASDFQKDE